MFRHDRRFLLPLCKPPRSLEIDVHAPERLAVSVVNGNAPMIVYASRILAGCRSLPLDQVPGAPLGIDPRIAVVAPLLWHAPSPLRTTTQ
jgi:hypothetical protein